MVAEGVRLGVRRISLMVLTVILGCAHTTEPRPTGPVLLLETYYMFGPCALAWTPSTPPVQTTVVDFHFLTGPSVQQIQALERGGAAVLNTFDVLGVVRVVIDVSAIPAVMRGPANPYYANTVADTTNHSPGVAHYFCATG